METLGGAGAEAPLPTGGQEEAGNKTALCVEPLRRKTVSLNTNKKPSDSRYLDSCSTNAMNDSEHSVTVQDNVRKPFYSTCALRLNKIKYFVRKTIMWFIFSRLV